MSDARPLDTRPHQIFLSYASADRDVAQKIAEKLRQSNLRVWFDAYELQAGDSLTARIQDAIMAGDYLVVLLSPDSVRSQWMKRELNASLSLELQSRTITILPVLIADGEIPSALAEIRHIDLRGDLDQGIERLVEQLNVIHSIDFSRLDAHAFESLIVELLEQIGFSEVVREWHTAERTFDIKATYTSTDPFDAEREEVWLVEVKCYRIHLQ